MARINLLPWREQQREERKKRFVATLGAVLVVAAGGVFIGDQYLNNAIGYQNARNEYIKKEIAVLDARIKEIKELKQRRAELIERMKIIQDLQGNRPIIARVFDQFVRTLPDGVYYNELKMAGKTIAINGAAESNARVSALMRSLDGSEWLASPNLNEVKAASLANSDLGNNFQLTVQQTQPGTDEAKEARQ